MNQNFENGDIVISTKGTKPAKILHWDNWLKKYAVRYLHNEEISTLSPDNLVLYNGPTEMTQQQNLYQFKSPTGRLLYGTYLATNQIGQWVMEEKGSGTLHTINKDDAEEVLPYTFSVKIRGNLKHFVGNPDQVRVDDVLMYTGGDYPEIAVVSALNTKNKSAATKFKGCRLVTEPLAEPQ